MVYCVRRTVQRLVIVLIYSFELKSIKSAFGARQLFRRLWLSDDDDDDELMMVMS